MSKKERNMELLKKGLLSEKAFEKMDSELAEKIRKSNEEDKKRSESLLERLSNLEDSFLLA